MTQEVLLTAVALLAVCFRGGGFPIVVLAGVALMIVGAGVALAGAVAIGWAMVWQSWPALLAAATLIPFFQAKARLERWLREKFSKYAEYEKQVRRFIPWIY